MTDTLPREILVLKRASGYLRLHLPPLLYVPALATRLEKALLALRGVRRVVVDRARARLSVFYDPWLTDDRAALLEIDRQATPLVERMEPEAFATALVEQRKARNERIVAKIAKAVYLGALVWAHWWALNHWLMDPFRYWWAWLLIGLGLWMHRRQIQAIPQL